MNWEDLERQFVSEGFGNGSLHPHVVHDPISYWESGRHADDVYVGFDFHWNDWEALFRTALNAAERDEYVQGEDIDEFHERNRRKFKDSIPDYPLLGRMFDMYEDAAFEATELECLRSECLRVCNDAIHNDAVRAANRIILACNKASESGLGLLFISD